MISKKENAIDITDEIATWSVRAIIKLSDVLEKNGYTETFFDGYDATFDVLKPKPPEGK